LARTEARIDELTRAAISALADVDVDPEAADVLTGLAAVATRRSG